MNNPHLLSPSRFRELNRAQRYRYLHDHFPKHAVGHTRSSKDVLEFQYSEAIREAVERAYGYPMRKAKPAKPTIPKPAQKRLSVKPAKRLNQLLLGLAHPEGLDGRRARRVARLVRVYKDPKAKPVARIQAYGELCHTYKGKYRPKLKKKELPTYWVRSVEDADTADYLFDTLVEMHGWDPMTVRDGFLIYVVGGGRT